jgi:hypothetical protein
LWLVVMVVLLLGGAAAPAHAYIDAGSGSYLFQLLIAGFVGLLYAVKLFWKRIRAFLVGLVGAHRNEADGR